MGAHCERRDDGSPSMSAVGRTAGCADESRVRTGGGVAARGEPDQRRGTKIECRDGSRLLAPSFAEDAHLECSSDGQQREEMGSADLPRRMMRALAFRSQSEMPTVDMRRDTL